MNSEVLEVQTFANAALSSVEAGARTDGSIPAMTTPTVVVATEYVVAGSTVCLIC
ncbi:cypemycin family RiPP [Rathayibacter tritici]|uniref:cypemycin family RiPP n=1 Tax=Rathayibacter tritici TaxID=33888 RepID=UPI0011B0BA6F|nr:cypemycin family RiPP [Rathayibacter tritici]